ncbi:hypothetical protein DQ04_08971010 [Trypanosoma grayi]|uniref:hypothetical protein n=1 Tax=Trypanosoma grayi TaxID=71804 RepID=UPI0004F4383C|nr:hypothetical protein DQ04_08971010 [Trypanosoma grayi]KEG07727.1 hypothetical protein DQ04_08971010 [Trypanosoma grayi]
MACAVLLREVPNLRDSPMPQHAAALVSDAANSNKSSGGGATRQCDRHLLGDAPKMPNAYLSRAWAMLMRIGSVLEEFQCLELAANYFELAAVILVQEEHTPTRTQLLSNPSDGGAVEDGSKSGKGVLKGSFAASLSEHASAAKTVTKSLWGRVGGALNQLKEGKQQQQQSSSSLPFPDADKSVGSVSGGPLQCALEVYPRTLLYEFSIALHRAAMVSAVARDYPCTLLYTDTLLQTLAAEAQRRRPTHDPPLFPQAFTQCGEAEQQQQQQQGQSVGEACSEENNEACIGATSHFTVLPTVAFVPPPKTTLNAFAFILTHLSRWVQLIVLKVYILLLHDGEGSSKDDDGKKCATPAEAVLVEIGVLFDLAGEMRRVGRGVIQLGAANAAASAAGDGRSSDGKRKPSLSHRRSTSAVGKDSALCIASHCLTTTSSSDDTPAAQQEPCTHQQEERQKPQEPLNGKAIAARALARRLLQSDALRQLRARAAAAGPTPRDAEQQQQQFEAVGDGDESGNEGACDTPHEASSHSNDSESACDDLHLRRIAAALQVVCARVQRYAHDPASVEKAPSEHAGLRRAVAAVDARLTAVGMRSRTLTIMGQRLLRGVFYPVGAAGPGAH